MAGKKREQDHPVPSVWTGNKDQQEANAEQALQVKRAARAPLELEDDK